MIGIDLEEVERLDLSEEFMAKVADKEEIQYILKSKCVDLQCQRLASLWAVKEAVMKALGLGGASKVSFHDIKLCHEENGKPYVELSGVAKREFDVSYYGRKIEISLSHTRHYATAIAIIQ